MARNRNPFQERGICYLKVSRKMKNLPAWVKSVAWSQAPRSSTFYLSTLQSRLRSFPNLFPLVLWMPADITFSHNYTLSSDSLPGPGRRLRSPSSSTLLLAFHCPSLTNTQGQAKQRKHQNNWNITPVAKQRANHLWSIHFLHKCKILSTSNQLYVLQLS